MFCIKYEIAFISTWYKALNIIYIYFKTCLHSPQLRKKYIHTFFIKKKNNNIINIFYDVVTR